MRRARGGAWGAMEVSWAGIGTLRRLYVRRASGLPTRAEGGLRSALVAIREPAWQTATPTWSRIGYGPAELTAKAT